MPNNYNGIAHLYDFLKNLTFGNSLTKAESYYLKGIEKKSTLLVIGCGSSEFLEYIDRNDFKEITCIDKSHRMCQKTTLRANKLGLKQLVSVINGDFPEISTEKKYDIIAFPFVLDCQPDDSISKMMNSAKELLHENGYLIITDFNQESNGIYNQLIIKLMYMFFKLSTNIQRKELPNFDRFINIDFVKLEKPYLNATGTVFSLKLKKISI